jgi:hypothetical protein
MTLTLDPSLIEGDPVRYLRWVFDKFRVYLRRKYPTPVKYIAVHSNEQEIKNGRGARI